MISIYLSMNYPVPSTVRHPWDDETVPVSHDCPTSHETAKPLIYLQKVLPSHGMGVLAYRRNLFCY